MANAPKPSRKPHPRSWIMNLPFNAADAEEKGLSPEVTQEIVYRMFCEKDATLESVAQRCLAEFSDFGCKQSPHGLANALSLWRPGYEMKRMFRTLDTRSKAYEAGLKDQFPGATPAQIAAEGQRFFTAAASAAGDAKTFQDLEYLRLAQDMAKTKAELELAKLDLRKVAESRSQQALKLEREKFETGIRTKVEAGLAEIAKQVKGNNPAEAALAKLQEAIAP